MKKVHRFLIPYTPIGTFTISDRAQIHLLKNVLKFKEGEQCIFFTDGGDDILCTLKKIEAKGVIAVAEKTLPKKKVAKEVTACISITKRDSFELIVQKLTELGIKAIVPILSGRTIKQAINQERLQKISDEALEQCGLSERVLLKNPIALEKALECYKETEQIYFDTAASSTSKRSSRNSTFYIGPEGGWSDEDRALFEKYHAQKALLSNSTLRSETAAIVAAYSLLWNS